VAAQALSESSKVLASRVRANGMVEA
jgi:hypothetical protein